MDIAIASVMERGVLKLVILVLLAPSFTYSTDPCSGSHCTVAQCIAETAELNSESVHLDLVCAKNENCHEVSCINSDGDEIKLSILECNNPPAVKVSTKDHVKGTTFSHTFTHSTQTVNATITGNHVHIAVTLIQDKDFNFQVYIYGLQSLLRMVFAPPSTYTFECSGETSSATPAITIDCSPNTLVIGLAIPVVALLCLVVIVTMAVTGCLVYRWCRESHLYSPLATANINNDEMLC